MNSNRSNENTSYESLNSNTDHIIIPLGIKHRIDSLCLKEVVADKILSGISVSVPVNILTSCNEYHFFVKENGQGRGLVYLLIAQRNTGLHTLYELDTCTSTSTEIITQVWEESLDMEWNWSPLYKVGKLILDNEDINKYKYVAKEGDKTLRFLYSLLEEVRNMLKTLRSLIHSEFKHLLISENVFDLEVRNVENYQYTVENVCNSSWLLNMEHRFDFIVCSVNTPKICTILDVGMGKEPSKVIFHTGEEVDFAPDNGFYTQGRTMNELLNEEDVMYLVDRFMGGKRYLEDEEEYLD